MLGERVDALGRRPTLEPEIFQSTQDRVVDSARRPAVMRGPVARGHFLIEEFSLQHETCDASDGQLLAEGQIAAELLDELDLDPAKKFPLNAAAIDVATKRAPSKGAGVRS